MHKSDNRATYGLLHGDKLHYWLLSHGIRINTVVST